MKDQSQLHRKYKQKKNEWFYNSKLSPVWISMIIIKILHEVKNNKISKVK